jgi:hypothetical protein
VSKEERYTYHCDQDDYVETIYDNEECEEIDSMKMAEKRLNRQQDKISDLEAKLAESEKEKDYYQDLYFTSVKGQEKLKQQLAEKELDIIRWKEHFYNAKMDYECLKEEIEKKDDEILKGDCAFVKEVYTSEQDKISFALEQLEKVKEIINKNYFYNMSSDSCTFDKLEVDFQIDNQINVLRNNKNEQIKN